MLSLLIVRKATAATFEQPRCMRRGRRPAEGRRADLRAAKRPGLVTEWLALTGQRWSEARAVRVRDVQDLPYPAVRVHRAQSDGYREKGPKTRRGVRAVPLVERARAIAAEFAAGKKPNDYLLTTITGRQMRANLYRRYTKWTATARGRHVHHLRHFAASEWLRRGVPVSQVAAWLGDDPRTVLQVYAHVMGEEQDREALALLNRSEKPGPPGDPPTTGETRPPDDKEWRKGQKIGGDGGI